VNFTGRHTTITPEIRKYCERRIRSIQKLLGYPVEANLILSVEKYRNKAEINIKTKGGTLNALEETRDMLSSLGEAFDNIEKRVKKEKEKLRERKRRKNKEFVSLPTETENVDLSKRVIRNRDFSYKPMTVDEAVLLFESSRNDVFVFRKFETERWAVLYRRKDGNFGLIEFE
jgi:putative sigma-54 modulation protein